MCTSDASPRVMLTSTPTREGHSSRRPTGEGLRPGEVQDITKVTQLTHAVASPQTQVHLPPRTTPLCAEGKAVHSSVIHGQLRARQPWLTMPGSAQQLPAIGPEELILNALWDTQSKGPQLPLKG